MPTLKPKRNHRSHMAFGKQKKYAFCLAWIFSLVALSFFVIISEPVLAQSSTDASLKKQQAQEKIDEIKKEIERSAEKAKELEQETFELNKEATELSDKMIAVASNIQAREGQITAGEARLKKLGFEENALRGELGQKKNTLTELLAGLQRLEKNPPPALVVNPNNALSAVRSAMLLGTIIPEIRKEANALTKNLTDLAHLKNKIEKEHRSLSENIAALRLERQDIEILLARKKKASESKSAAVKEERLKIEKLAQESKTLQDFLSRVTREIEKKHPKGSKNLALKMRGIKKPSIKFTKSKGKINFPVQGTKVREYGVDDGLGGTSKGLSIATRKNAQITAPSDGLIVYAGQFRSYGKLLILDVGEEYHVLIAGMDKIQVTTGQFVIAGEPVGRMTNSNVRTASLFAPETTTKPILYVEFRQKGVAVNPKPWWADQKTASKR